jgi:hypothetical protein
VCVCVSVWGGLFQEAGADCEGGDFTDVVSFDTLTRTEAGKFTLGSAAAAGHKGDEKEEEEEDEEVDARAELQSFLELQCVTRASR